MTPKSQRVDQRKQGTCQDLRDTWDEGTRVDQANKIIGTTGREQSGQCRGGLARKQARLIATVSKLSA